MPVACMGDTQSPGRTAPYLQLAVKKVQSFGTQAAEHMDEVLGGGGKDALVDKSCFTPPRCLTHTPIIATCKKETTINQYAMRTGTNLYQR